MEQYLASTDDHERVVYFLVPQEISKPPRVTNYPVNDRRVRGQTPQSESQ